MKSCDPCASRARLDPDSVVYGLSEPLFVTQVFFRGLRGNMP